MKFMLDTNICIYVINRQPAKVIKKLLSHKVDDLCLSSITLSELRYGAEKSQNQQKNHDALSEFTAVLNIVQFDEKAAFHYGSIRTYLEKSGKIIGPLDTLIGAHARSLGLTLVTNNIKEFDRIPHLKVANWVNE